MAPRNFDQDLPDDLSFVAQGETFTMALVGPSVLATFEDAEDVKDGAEAVQRARERTTAFLQEGDRARWEKLLKAEKIPYIQLQQIQKWMLEVQTGRPTEKPSPSESGPGGTGRTSRAKSS